MADEVTVEDLARDLAYQKVGWDVNSLDGKEYYRDKAAEIMEKYDITRKEVQHEPA